MKKLLFIFFLVLCFFNKNFSQEQKKDTLKPVFTIVEEMPQYPGGDEARVRFLQENVKYPQEAKNNGIQGKVYVTFVIDEKGNVTDVRIIRSIGGGCDAEALRVIKLMPKWLPGKQSGKPVRVQYNMPIIFTLENSNKNK
ncbi:MAG: energy transducer TonB [Bacteroidales bacterium]|jgi:TonB family protein